MILYISISVVILILCLFSCIRLELNTNSLDDIYTKKSTENFFYCVIMTFLWFLTAFRSANIGNDTIPYLIDFQGLCYFGENHHTRFEYGYSFLCQLISKYTENPHYFLIIIATICYVGVGIYIFKKSEHKYISICIFYALFFSAYTNILRQAIAMTIGLWAYELFKKNKLIKSSLLIILAYLFHSTALCLFFLFFVQWIPKSKKKIIIISIILAILSMMGKISGIVSLITNKYDGYFEGDRAGSGWLGVTLNVFKALVLFWIIYLSIGKETDRNSSIVRAIFVFSLFFNILGYQMNIFSRIGAYFQILSLADFPNYIVKGNIKNKSIILFGTCVGLVVLFIITNYLRPEWNRLIPYEFWKE